MKIPTPFRVPLFSVLLCLSFIPILGFQTVTAQKIKGDEQINSKWAADSLKIDGELADWKDSLSFYNEDTRFAFSVSNNNQTLFIAVKSQDSKNLGRIFSRGISFSFNTEGKKKAISTIVFPVIERGGQANRPAKAPTAAQIKDLQKKMLSDIKRFNVYGFPDVRDGAISIQNTYGISAAATFDSQENLVIEIAVPLRLLGVTTDHQPIACLFEINGIKAPRATYDPNRDTRNTRYGYPTRDYGYERLPRYNRINEPTGFWVKTTLAKTSTIN